MCVACGSPQPFPPLKAITYNNVVQVAQVQNFFVEVHDFFVAICRFPFLKPLIFNQP